MRTWHQELEQRASDVELFNETEGDPQYQHMMVQLTPGEARIIAALLKNNGVDEEYENEAL